MPPIGAPNGVVLLGLKIRIRDLDLAKGCVCECMGEWCGLVGEGGWCRKLQLV